MEHRRLSRSGFLLSCRRVAAGPRFRLLQTPHLGPQLPDPGLQMAPESRGTQAFPDQTRTFSSWILKKTQNRWDVETREQRLWAAGQAAPWRERGQGRGDRVTLGQPQRLSGTFGPTPRAALLSPHAPNSCMHL